MFEKFEKVRRNLTKLETIKILVSLALPAAVGIFTFVTTLQNRHIAQLERYQDMEQTDDQQRETIFINYINDIARFRDQNIDSFNDPDKVIYIRSKTLTTLRKLDIERKKFVLLFLRDSSILPVRAHSFLSGADFNQIEINDDDCEFQNVTLWGFQFREVSFTSCTFYNVTFRETKFSNAHLIRSTFYKVRFVSCVMDRVNFQESLIAEVYFNDTSMVFSNFSSAKMDTVNFFNCNLTGASFYAKLTTRIFFLNSILPNRTFSAVQPLNSSEKDCIWINEATIKAAENIKFDNCTWIGNSNRAVIFLEIPIPFNKYSMLIDADQAEFSIKLRRNDTEPKILVSIFLVGIEHSTYKPYSINCPINVDPFCVIQVHVVQHTRRIVVGFEFEKADLLIDRISYTLDKKS